MKLLTDCWLMDYVAQQWFLCESHFATYYMRKRLVESVNDLNIHGFFEYFLVTYACIWFVRQSFRQQRSLSWSLKKNPIPYRMPQWRNLQPSVKRRNKLSKFQAQRRMYDIVDMPQLVHCLIVQQLQWRVLITYSYIM